MDRNEILEKNLFEAGRLLKESKKMITLTYAERVYLQQWIFEKTGNMISTFKCDLEEALKVFYEDKKPKEPVVDEQIIDEIIENSEVSEKQTTTTKPTTKKSTTAKTKKIEDNETKESEEADDKL